jgi:hypothetical protein
VTTFVTFLTSLGALIGVLFELLLWLVGTFGGLLLWCLFWLCAVNWKKGWTALAQGGWMPVVLLNLVVALVWSGIAPSNYDVSGLFSLSNFWWQLLVVVSLTLLALFFGWLQGVLGWAPPEIDLEPPAVEHGHGHHGHHPH